MNPFEVRLKISWYSKDVGLIGWFNGFLSFFKKKKYININFTPKNNKIINFTPKIISYIKIAIAYQYWNELIEFMLTSSKSN